MIDRRQAVVRAVGLLVLVLMLVALAIAGFYSASRAQAHENACYDLENTYVVVIEFGPHLSPRAESNTEIWPFVQASSVEELAEHLMVSQQLESYRPGDVEATIYRAHDSASGPKIFVGSEIDIVWRFPQHE